MSMEKEPSQNVPQTLGEIVTAFLELALKHPEKEPKTQRAQRDNSMMILGYNQAQETLRTLLQHYGQDDAVRGLADVRSDGQQRPIDVGGCKAWVAG